MCERHNITGDGTGVRLRGSLRNVVDVNVYRSYGSHRWSLEGYQA